MSIYKTGQYTFCTNCNKNIKNKLLLAVIAYKSYDSEDNHVLVRETKLIQYYTIKI